MEGEMDQMDPGQTIDSNHTSSSNSDDLNGKAAEDENDATTSSTAGGKQQAEDSDSDLEMVETDDEEVEEITIIELSDTEIREEEEEEEDNDSEDEEEFVIKEEPPDDYEDGLVNFDPSQLGLIVTQTELPEDLIGDPVNDMYKCRFCPSKFPAKLRLVAHIERHINNGAIRKCRFCEFYTAVKQTLLEHECKHTKEKPYQCSVCDYRCRLKGDLGRHLEVHSNTKRYRCKECGHQTRSAGNLKRHMERHQPDMPRNFVCPLCGAAFKRRSALHLHTDRRHTEGKPFCCDQCSFCSKTMWELKTHKAKHSDQHPFHCSWPGCQKAFKTKSDSTKHLKRHSGVKDYECNICGKKFFNSTLLRKHAFAHSEVRNFECGQCLKKFKTLRDLKVHLSTHQWVKPFPCEVCCKTFGSQFNLDKHREMHGGGRPYQCPVCLHGSRQMEHLMAHVGSEHLHNFTYVCVLCRKPFRKSMHLQFHVQRCHKDAMQGAGEGTLVYDPRYLDHDFQPEATGAFHPTTFAKLLASENLKAAWPAATERDTEEVKQEPGLVNAASDDSGVSSGSPGEAPSSPDGKQRLPPVVQLGRYAGIPFCLARRDSGLQLNCQKKGKKPRGWFMDPAHMSQADAERHRLYLTKKALGLLPPSHWRQRSAPKASRRGRKAGGARGRGRGRGRGKGRWGSRTLSVKEEDEDSEDEDDAYMLAQRVFCQLEGEGSTPQADGQSPRASPRSRKPAVHFKNLPGDYFDGRPKKCRLPPEDSKAHLGFLLQPSTSCYPAGKTANRKRNKKQVVKKTPPQLPRSSRNYVAKKGSGSWPSGGKASPGRKRKGSRGDHSWASALAGPLPVSHYRAQETALNTLCWLNALRSSAPRGRFTPWAPTSTLPTTTLPTTTLQAPGDSREEFARCLQLQVRMPSHHEAPAVSQSPAPGAGQEEACGGGLAEEHGDARVETVMAVSQSPAPGAGQEEACGGGLAGELGHARVETVTGVVTDGNSVLHDWRSDSAENQSHLSIWRSAKECVWRVVDAVGKGQGRDGQVSPDTDARSGSCHVGVNRDVPNSDNNVVEISRGFADSDNSDDMTTTGVAAKDASLSSVVVVDEVEASSVLTSQFSSDVDHPSTQNCNNTTHAERTGNQHVVSLEEKSPFAFDVDQTLKDHDDSPADGEIIGTQHAATMEENNIGNDHQQDGHFEHQGDKSREDHSVSTMKPLENIAQSAEAAENDGQATAQSTEAAENDSQATAQSTEAAENDGQATAQSTEAAENDGQATAQSTEVPENDGQATAQSTEAAENDGQATAQSTEVPENDGQATAQSTEAAENDGQATAQSTEAAENDGQATAQSTEAAENDGQATAQSTEAAENDGQATAQSTEAAENDGQATAQSTEAAENDGQATAQSTEAAENDGQATAQCRQDTAAEKRSEVQALPMEMADEKEHDKEAKPQVSVVQEEEEGSLQAEHCSTAPWEKVAQQGEVHTDTLLSEDNMDGEEERCAEWEVEETSLIITETRSLAPQHCLAEDSGQPAMEDTEENVHLIKTEESVTELLSPAPPSRFSKCLHVLVSDVQTEPCTGDYLHSLGVSRVVFLTDHTTPRAKCTTPKVLNHSTKKTLKSLPGKKIKQAVSKTTKQQNKKLVTKKVPLKRPRGKSCGLKSAKVKKPLQPCEMRIENATEGGTARDSLTEAVCSAPGASVSGISALLLASATATKHRKSPGKASSHSVNSTHTQCAGKASSRATGLKQGKSASKAKRPVGKSKALSPKPSPGAKQPRAGGGTRPAQTETQTVKKCGKSASKKTSVRPSKSSPLKPALISGSSVDEDAYLTSAAGDDGEDVPSGVSTSQSQVPSDVDLTTPSLSTAASPGPSKGCVKPAKKRRKANLPKANLPGQSAVRVVSFHVEPPVKKKRGRPKKIPLDGSRVNQCFDPSLSLLAGQDQTGVCPAAEKTGVLCASSDQASTRKVLLTADMSDYDKTDNSSAPVTEAFTIAKEASGTEGRQPVKTKRKYTKQKKNTQKNTPPGKAAKRRGRVKTKLVRGELAETASAKTICAVRGSENSAFKMSKPLRKERSGGRPGRRPSKGQHEASLEKDRGRKRKRYMYVETDTGEFPEPPPAKKRGRPPGPKIILDRSQVNLCFDQVPGAPGDQDHGSADLAAPGVTQDGDPVCLGTPHALHCDPAVSQPHTLYQQADPPQFFTAHLPPPCLVQNTSQLPVSSAPCVAQISQGQMTERPVAELGARSRVVADVKPTVSELNQYVTYPEVKPNVGELSALNGSAASRTVLAETCAAPAASVAAVQSSAALTGCDGADSLRRAQLLQVLTSHMDTGEGDACHHPQSSAPAVHPRVKPIVLAPSSRGRKRKPKDDTFHVQPRYKHLSGMPEDAEVRRSDRRKKPRLTEEQIRLAAGLDWADPDPDGEEGDAAFWYPDGEDVGADVEFVGADYSHVDLDAQRLSLEDTFLGTDVGEEGTLARPASGVRVSSIPENQNGHVAGANGDHVSSIPQDQDRPVAAPPASLTDLPARELGNEAHTRLVTEGQPGDGPSSCMPPPSLSPVNQTFTVQVSDRGCVLLAMDQQKGSAAIPPHPHNQQGGCGLRNTPVNQQGGCGLRNTPVNQQASSGTGTGFSLNGPARSPISVSRLTNGVELTLRPATPPIPLTHPVGTHVTSGLSPNQLANQMGASVTSAMVSSQPTNQVEVPIGSGLCPLTISVKTIDGQNVLL